MKQNKTSAFVKIFVPEKEQIDKKQLISLWGSPHSKEFHIIDNPSIVNRIANEFDNSRRPYSSVKTRTQTCQSVKRQKPLYIVKKTRKNIQRLNFGKLGQQVNCLSDFIENQVSDLQQSQIFQYKQKMLVTFLQDFFQQLQKECHQKAYFIKQIWNQMISLFDRVFSIQNENSLNYEKSSLNEILNLHKSYQEIVEKLKKQIKKLYQESLKHKQLIKSLVINLKQKKKEIKVYQGGIDEYNQKINNLSYQFDELKKEHLEILMYGHHGNMTRAEAESMLMTILKPQDQDEQDMRTKISIKYIPPRIKKGKSDKYLKAPTDQNKLQEKYLSQNDHIQDQINVNRYELRGNFVPRKIGSKNSQKTCDVKVQTNWETVENQKVSTFIECNYYDKMNFLIIKNKYCQTENKKPQRNNSGNQTNWTGTQSIFEIKASKLGFIDKIYDIKILNKYCRNSKFLKLNSSQRNLEKLCLEFQGKSLIHEDSKQMKSHNSSKSSSRQHKIQSSKDKKKGLARLSHKNSNTNLKVSSKKSKIELRNITEHSESGIKTPLRTQNFVRLNKARVSGQLKNMLIDFIETQNKNILPKYPDLQRSVGLLKVYLYQKNQIVFINKTNLNGNWGEQMFMLIKNIKDYPSQKQIFLSFYYRTKVNKNKNIALENLKYVSRLKDIASSPQSCEVSKKKEKSISSNYPGILTVKKCFKVIEQVFEVYFKMKKHNEKWNLNPLKILQKVLNPSSLKSLKEKGIQSNQSEQFQKSIEFLSFLIRNINQNHLFRNFIFLCGVNVNDQVPIKKDSGVYNMNKSIKIKEVMEKDKKSIHIDSAIKNYYYQSQQKAIQKQQFGTMVYSSEIQFYFDMLDALNCRKNDQNDLLSFYTTLEVLQTNFEKLSKYYKNFNLVNNIKKVIQESMKDSMLNNSKLNIFKCLQIFLENIRDRKIKMFKSYQTFYKHLPNKPKQDINKIFLLDILRVLKVQKQTQLKIISNFFKFYQDQATLEDFATFFLIQGFPQFEQIKQNVLNKIGSNDQLYYQKNEKINNAVLEFIYQNISKDKSSKLGKNLQNFNTFLLADEIIDKNVNQIIGEKLCNFEIACIFLNCQKK